MLTTTIHSMRKYSFLNNSWDKIINSLEKKYNENELISFKNILKDIDFDDILFIIRSIPLEFENFIRMYSINCAKHIFHLITDERSINALKISELFIKEHSILKDLKKANEKAWFVNSHSGRAVAYTSNPYEIYSSVFASTKAAAWAVAEEKTTGDKMWSIEHFSKWKINYEKEREWQLEEFVRLLHKIES